MVPPESGVFLHTIEYEGGVIGCGILVTLYWRRWKDGLLQARQWEK